MLRMISLALLGALVWTGTITAAEVGRSYRVDGGAVFEQWRDAQGRECQRPIYLAPNWGVGKSRMLAVQAQPSPNGTLVAIHLYADRSHGGINVVAFVNPWTYQYFGGQPQSACPFPQTHTAHSVGDMVWTRTERGQYQLVADLAPAFVAGPVEPTVVTPVKTTVRQEREESVYNVHRLVSEIMQRVRRRHPRAFALNWRAIPTTNELWFVSVQFDDGTGHRGSLKYDCIKRQFVPEAEHVCPDC